MVERIGALAEDAKRLMFACEFDGYDGVPKDKYEFAMEVAAEHGREEPTPEDELNGLRRLIDAARTQKEER